MKPDWTFPSPHSINRMVVVCGVMATLGGFAITEASGQSYPLPRSKPAIKAGITPAYPLPREKPPGSKQPSGTAPDQNQSAPPLWKQLLDKARPRTKPGTRAADAESRVSEIKSSGSWSSEQISKARQACRDILKGLALTYSEAKPVGGPGGCGIAAPIKVSSIGKQHPVAIRSTATINCKLAAATVKWAETVLQKAAMAEFGEPVIKMRNAAAYVCRRRNNKPSGKLSEHALGNALDISSFTLASGKTVTVLKGWPMRKSVFSDDDTGASSPKPANPAPRFLRQVHKGACTIYSTVLGPKADAYHVNHFHFDLGRGGRYLICK